MGLLSAQRQETECSGGSPHVLCGPGGLTQRLSTVRWRRGVRPASSLVSVRMSVLFSRHSASTRSVRPRSHSEVRVVSVLERNSQTKRKYRRQSCESGRSHNRHRRRQERERQFGAEPPHTCTGFVSFREKPRKTHSPL